MRTNQVRPPATGLRTEHRTNPLGIDPVAPRLSWIIPSMPSGMTQSAYQIQSADSAADLTNNGSAWDSGRIEQGASHLVRYEGAHPVSGQPVWWRVRYWDQAGIESQWSEPAFWEYGLGRSTDWKARWLRFSRPRPEIEGRILPPCSFVRRAFTLHTAAVRGRAYATARGVYRLFVNGRPVGNDELAPGWTDYTRRVQYQTYDITDLLQVGENVIGAIVGDGWYCGYVGFNGERDHYGREPELLAQLNVELTDGTCVIIGTDKEWKQTIGPIEYSDMLMGERYDARKELIGWSDSGYDDSDWRPVSTHWRPATSSPLVAQPDNGIRVTEDLVPVRTTDLPDGSRIVDLGQNMVGRVRLRLQGDAGTVVRLRFAEVLNADGALYVSNLRGARQADEYVMRGGGIEQYEPLFTFHGFRYVHISGYSGPWSVDSLIGRVMESATERTGYLESGHAMVNRLIRNIEWGQRGNFISVPTDCPQRDERLGWLGDAQVFARTASYNRNVAPFFTKWLADVRDGQTTLGSFPNVAPLLVMDGDGAPAWGDAGVIIPWTMYLMYGDLAILETSYESIVKWLEYLERGNPDLIWRERSSYNFSDWLSIEADTPADVLATAYFAYDSILASRIATVLGKKEDAKRFHTLFERIKAAFNREFVSPDGVIHGNTQTCYLLGLHMNLLSEEHRHRAAQHLIADLESRNWHLSTGFIGVGYLCPMLSEIGHAETAYRLLLNETFPSWGYSIKHGATTIWERWDGWTDHMGFQDPSMNSFNHYSLGSVGEWLYRFAAGIDVAPEGAGFRSFILKPYPDERLGYLHASFISPYGEITSKWQVTPGTLSWSFTVPANTTATIYVPADGVRDIRVSSNPATAGSALEYVGQEEDRTVFRAAPGSYDLQVRTSRRRILAAGEASPWSIARKDTASVAKD